MRKLILADVPRFSRMIEAAGVREIIADGLQQAAEYGQQKRAELLRLKKALDAATEPGQRDDIARQLLNCQQDDAALTRLGIDAALQVLGAAARRGVDECIYRFLAPILEMDAEAVAALPLEELGGLLRKMAQGNNLADFFDLPGVIQAKSGK